MYRFYCRIIGSVEADAILRHNRVSPLCNAKRSIFLRLAFMRIEGFRSTYACLGMFFK